MTTRPIVLVTGAGGFVGGRIVEVLHCSGNATVRAGVRRWSSAARIGRFPVDIALCDIMDPAQVDAAMEGVDAVVHCAVGNRDVTTQGTRNVLSAAVRHGVNRVVHISTIDVYGDALGPVDEQTAFGRTGREYGDSKIEAELVCREFHEAGLPVTILRPTIVYGPFSELWTVEFAQRFQAESWLLPEEDCGGNCNLVYIDDVVSAVLLALENDAAVGLAFNINGPDNVTWNEYFRALNDSLGLAPLPSTGRNAARLSSALMAPVRKSAKFILRHWSAPVMALYQRYDFMKAMMKYAEGRIRQTPTSNEFRLYSRQVSFPTTKAQALLGYAPAFDMRAGIELSAAWLRDAGYVSSA